jgi:hypothetical protein
MYHREVYGVYIYICMVRGVRKLATRDIIHDSPNRLSRTSIIYTLLRNNNTSMTNFFWHCIRTNCTSPVYTFFLSKYFAYILN